MVKKVSNKRKISNIVLNVIDILLICFLIYLIYGNICGTYDYLRSEGTWTGMKYEILISGYIGGIIAIILELVLIIVFLPYTRMRKELKHKSRVGVIILRVLMLITIILLVLIIKVSCSITTCV